MRLLTTLLTCGLLTLTACGDSGPTAKQTRDEAVASRDAAETALSTNNVEAAKKAADDAEAKAEALRTQLAEKHPDLRVEVTPDTRDDTRSIDLDTLEDAEPASDAKKVQLAVATAQAEIAAAEARVFAQTAEERQQLAEQLETLKLRSYRGVRGYTLKGVFKSMALAARQADKVGIDALPDTMRQPARAAADFVRRHAGDAVADAPGKIDWANIAERMSTLAENLPPQTSMTVASSLMLYGQFSFALAELETIDPATLTADDRTTYHALRGLALRMNGYPRLSQQEFGQLGIDASSMFARENTPAMQAGWHMLMFASHLSNGELLDADREIGRAARAWPNNPVMVFLTGEKLTAEGDLEAAALSLEAFAEKAGDGWVSERVAARARELRDAKGNPRPLIADHKFLLGLTRYYLGEASKESEMAESAKRWYDDAATFGKQLLEKLPGVGPTEDAAPAAKEPGEADEPSTPSDASKS